MKELTYNFMNGLKELSKKYNFNGVLHVDLSPSSFKLCNYYTEFHIHTKAEDFTTIESFNLQNDIETLLTNVKYPANLRYSFTISSNDRIIYKLFNGSYEPRNENKREHKIEFPCDNTKETQFYTLSFDNGGITLEKYNDDISENYFKDNPEVIDFLNSFIDNKIPKTNITFTKAEYNTLTSIVFLAEESMLELAEKYPNPIELEQLEEQKQHIAEIVRKVRELTNNK